MPASRSICWRPSRSLPIRIFTALEYSSRPDVSAVPTLLILVWLLVHVPLYARFLDVRHA